MRREGKGGEWAWAGAAERRVGGTTKLTERAQAVAHIRGARERLTHEAAQRFALGLDEEALMEVLHDTAGVRLLFNRPLPFVPGGEDGHPLPLAAAPSTAAAAAVAVAVPTLRGSATLLTPPRTSRMGTAGVVVGSAREKRAVDRRTVHGERHVRSE